MRRGPGAGRVGATSQRLLGRAMFGYCAMFGLRRELSCKTICKHVFFPKFNHPFWCDSIRQSCSLSDFWPGFRQFLLPPGRWRWPLNAWILQIGHWAKSDFDWAVISGLNTAPAGWKSSQVGCKGKLRRTLGDRLSGPGTLKNKTLLQHLTGWWFGTFFIFPYIGNSTVTPTD